MREIVTIGGKKRATNWMNPLPAEACRLAAPLERREPEPLHLVEEPPQARVVIRKDLI